MTFSLKQWGTIIIHILFYIEISFSFSLMFCTQVTQNDKQDDRYENNNRQNNAKEIEIGDVDSLISNDDDWFYIIVKQKTGLEIFFQPYYEMNFNVTVKPLRTIVKKDIFIFPTVEVNDTIFIHGFKSSMANNRYSIHSRILPPDDTLEDNDSSAFSKTITFGTMNKLQCYDDDFFKINLGSDTKLATSLDYNSVYGDFYLCLINSTNDSIWSSECNIGHLELIYKGKLNETVTIWISSERVRGKSYFDGEYQLKNQPFIDDIYEPNDTIGKPIGITVTDVTDTVIRELKLERNTKDFYLYDTKLTNNSYYIIVRYHLPEIDFESYPLIDNDIAFTSLYDFIKKSDSTYLIIAERPKDTGTHNLDFYSKELKQCQTLVRYDLEFISLQDQKGETGKMLRAMRTSHFYQEENALSY